MRESFRSYLEKDISLEEFKNRLIQNGCATVYLNRPFPGRLLVQRFIDNQMREFPYLDMPTSRALDGNIISKIVPIAIEESFFIIMWEDLPRIICERIGDENWANHRL